MLGQIEREESSPTIATLWKIASGFETSFSSFIEEINPASSEAVFRAGEAIRFNANQQHGYRNLMSKVATFHDIIHYPGTN